MEGLDPPKEKPVILTRTQKRWKEKIEREAETMHMNLVLKFHDFIVTCDSESEINDKKRQLIAQWVLYCKSKSLLPIAHSVLEQSLNKVIQKYIQNGGIVKVSKWTAFKIWIGGLSKFKR